MSTVSARDTGGPWEFQDKGHLKGDDHSASMILNCRSLSDVPCEIDGSLHQKSSLNSESAR